MALTEQQARRRIELGVAWDQAPALSSEDVDELVVMAKVRDAYGLYPDETGWTVTWDTSAAIAEGWRWKAAKASGAVDISDGWDSIKRSQMHDHCLEMADKYQARSGAGSGGIASRPVASSAGGGRDAATGVWDPVIGN